MRKGFSLLFFANSETFLQILKAGRKPMPSETLFLCFAFQQFNGIQIGFLYIAEGSLLILFIFLCGFGDCLIVTDRTGALPAAIDGNGGKPWWL